jgi:hypothetical protein
MNDAPIVIDDGCETACGRCSDFKTSSDFIAAINEDAGRLDLECVGEGSPVERKTMIYSAVTIQGDNLVPFTGNDIEIADYWIVSVNPKGDAIND